MSFSKLNLSSIRAEALRLFHNDGLEGVGIRRIAASLNVRPSALYRHVRDKEELHGMLAGDLFQACLDQVSNVTGWDEWLHAFGLALWDAQTTMPDIGKLIITNVTPHAVTSKMRRQIVDALTSYGMPETLARVAQHSVMSLATGWATFNTDSYGGLQDRAPFLEALAAQIDGWRSRVTPHMSSSNSKA